MPTSEITNIEEALLKYAENGNARTIQQLLIIQADYIFEEDSLAADGTITNPMLERVAKVLTEKGNDLTPIETAMRFTADQRFAAATRAKKHRVRIGKTAQNAATEQELEDIAIYQLAQGQGPTLVKPPSTLNILIKDLSKRDIIPQTLIEKIQASQNVNEIEDYTALHRAASRGTIADIENLFREGAMFDCLDAEMNSPFAWAVEKGRAEIVDYFLNLPSFVFSPNSLLNKNVEGKNALHLAVEANHPEIVTKLLKDSRFHSTISEPDLYQRTPLDYAIRNKFKQIIRLLLGKSDAELTDDNIEIMPNYGVAFKDWSQLNLNVIIGNYLTAQKRKKDLILDKNGNCGAWSFLRLLYANEVFEAILDEVARYEESAFDNTELEKSDLPSLLKHYFKVENRGQFLEYLVSHLAYFQQTSPNVKALQMPGIDQSSFIELYNMAKDLNLNRTLNLAFQFFDLTFNRSQLIEFFHYLSKWPGKSMMLGSAEHFISFKVTNDGHFDYYDSNLSAKVDMFEPSQLANHLMKTIWNIPDNDKDSAVKLSRIQAFQFYRKNEPVPITETASGLQPLTDSPNGYTELHYAVLSNNNKIIKESLEKGKKEGSIGALLQTRDQHNDRSIDLAIKMENIDAVKMLMHAADLENLSLEEIDFSNHFDPFVGLKHMSNRFMEQFIDEKIIKKYLKELSITCVYKSHLLGLTIAKALIADASLKPFLPIALLVALSENAHIDIISFLLKNIEKLSDDDTTLLMVAVRNKAQADVIQALLSKPELDINKKNNQGKNAIQLAFEYHTNSTALLPLIQDSRFDIQQVDEVGNSLLLQALHQEADPSVIAALLKIKALDINKKNQAGQSAFDLAQSHSSEEAILKLLLADPRFDSSVLSPKMVYENKIFVRQLIEAAIKTHRPDYVELLLSDQDEGNLNTALKFAETIKINEADMELKARKLELISLFKKHLFSKKPSLDTDTQVKIAPDVLHDFKKTGSNFNLTPENSQNVTTLASSKKRKNT